MTLTQNAIETAIKAKVVEIADKLDCDARSIRADDLIPATGYIDSAGLLELIAWYEREYHIKVAQEEMTIDNLGTLTSMAQFVLRRRAPG